MFVAVTALAPLSTLPSMYSFTIEPGMLTILPLFDVGFELRPGTRDLAPFLDYGSGGCIGPLGETLRILLIVFKFSLVIVLYL